MTTMKLHWIDWSLILGYCVVAFGIGTYFAKRASQNMGEFFLAGRQLPWWLAGTSIVATSFAADTPLVVSGMIRKAGIYENWLWWNVLMGGMLCVFFYARLWRRAGVITDVEFMELRYAGRPASFLRGFMAIYKGVLSNCITMGWVMLAMAKISEVMLGWDKVTSLTVLILIALIYTVMSGFWGVVMTDLIQFVMAMTGSIALAGIVLWKMGGPSGMVSKVSAAPGFKPQVFHMVPDLSSATTMALLTFVILMTVKWWTYGQGSGALAQRIFATRSEKDSLLAVLWFNFAHYVLRPWPWIIVGLASIVYFPLDSVADAEKAYPLMIMKFLPVGLRGLMVASLLAAFMSTIDTHLNWGASYLVNDLYKRFLRPDEKPAHYVNVSRVAMVLLMGLAALTSWQFTTVKGAWIYLMVLTSGAGFVGLLRWYWWRVNVWSEVSALVASFCLANGFVLVELFAKLGWLTGPALANARWFYGPKTFAIRILVIFVLCTTLWVIVTLLTKPVENTKLESFYRKVRPSGWWGPVATRCADVKVSSVLPLWADWAAGVTCIYCGLFGVGYLCLAQYLRGGIFLAIGSVAGAWMLRRLSALKD